MKMKRILAGILTFAMLFTMMVPGVAAAGDPAVTVAVTDEVVNAETGIRKLVATVTGPADVSTLILAMSYDNSVIDARMTGGKNNVVNITNGSTNTAAFVSAYADEYDEQMIARTGVKWAVNSGRTAFAATYSLGSGTNYDSDNGDAYTDTGVDCTNGVVWCEFYYSVKEGATVDSKTFRFESFSAKNSQIANLGFGTDANRNAVFVGLKSNPSGYKFGGASADTMTATLTYAGIENTPAVAKVTVSAQDTVEVNGEAAGVSVALTTAVLDSDDEAIPGKTADLSENSDYAEIVDGALVVDGKTPNNTEIIVTASCDGKTGTKTITVTRAAAEFDQFNMSDATVELDGVNPKTVTLTAYDQFGDVYPVEFEWDEDYSGLAPIVNNADGTGTITIAATTAEGDYWFKFLVDQSAMVTVKHSEASENTATAIEVSGEETIAVPYATVGYVTESYAAVAKNIYGEEISNPEIDWTVTAAEGVSIDENGNLTVISKAAAGTVTVTAACGTVTETLDVEIEKEAPALTSIDLSETSVTVNGRYNIENAVVEVLGFDQYGAPMAVPTVTANSTGAVVEGSKILVSQYAAAGIITVTAGDLTAELEVKREASVPASVELSAETDSVKIGNSKTYTATVYDQFYDSYDMVPYWTVTGNDKVTVDTNGKVTVEADAVVGSTAIVTVTAGDVKDTLTITVIGKDEMTISGLSVAGGTYNGSAFAYTGTAAGSFGGNAVDLSDAEITVLYTGTGDTTYSSATAPVNAGAYKVAVTFENAEYIGTWEGTFTISPAEIDVSGCKWDYTEFTYDGTEKTVALKSVPAGAEVSYDGNKATDAGDYTASVSFTTDANHVIAGSVADLAWEIAPAVIELTSGDLTWSAAEFEYDGSEKTVALTIGGEHAAKFDISYANNVKTDAAEYTAVATLKLKAEFDNNYDFTVNAADLQCAWEITRKPIAVPTANELTYNGKAQTGVNAGEGYELTGDVTKTDAGNYTATATLDSNHKWSDDTITVKDIAWSIATKEIAVDAYVDGKDYDGTKNVDKVEILFDNLADGESLVKGTDYTVTAAFASEDADEDVEVDIEVELISDKAQNYCFDNGTYAIALSTTAAIAPADYTVAVDNKLDVKVGATNLKALLPKATATASVAGESITGTLTWDVEDDSVAALNVGDTFTANWRYVQTNGNYVTTEKTGSTVITIVDGDPQTIVFDLDAATETYGVAPFTNEAELTVGAGAISYASSNTDVATVDAATGKVTVKNVGTTTITATAAAVPGEWAKATDSYTLTVTAREIAVDVTAQTITYGAALPTEWEAALASGSKFGYSDTLADLNLAFAVESAADYEVGSYDVTVTIDNANYVLADDTLADKLSVTKADPKTFADKTVTAFSDAVVSEDKTYTVSLTDALTTLGADAAIKVVNAAIANDANISAEAAGSDVVITVKPTVAAEEAALFHVLLSSKNYEDSSVVIVVNVVDKTNVDGKIDFDDDTVIWNGEAQALAAAKFNGTAQGTGVFTYSVDGATWSETMPTFTEAGEHTVYAKYEDDTQIGEASAVLKITNKLDVYVAVVENDEFENNGKYEVEDVTNEADENAAYVEVKGTKALEKFISTDLSLDEEHKWIGLLIETTVNGEITTDLYVSVDGETFMKLDASDFTISAANGGDGNQIVLWIATDVNDEVTLWIATDDEGSDALKMDIEFTAYKKNSGSSNSADSKKAEKVEDLIDKIGSKVTLDDQKAIEKARDAYDDLTRAQKKLVDNYDDLVKAEKKLEKLLEEQEDEIELPFTDVDSDDSIYEAVKFVYQNGLMVGVGDGTLFAPETGLTRSMLARILHAYAGEPIVAASAFDDVARGMWYTTAIDWAAARGIFSGYGNGNFGPNDTLTREQLAVVLYQYAQSMGYDVSVGENTNILSYNDAFSISNWAFPAMQWACAEDILTDVSGNIRPGAPATRADVAEAFFAFLQRQ